MTKAPIKLTLDQVDNDLERLFRVQETADHLAYGREDLLQAISGPIGELWAARLLLTLGYIVFKMPKSAQKIDLKIMLPGGDYLPIQVKSLQAKKGPYLVPRRAYDSNTLFIFVCVEMGVCRWAIVPHETVIHERDSHKYSGQSVTDPNPYVNPTWAMQYENRTDFFPAVEGSLSS
jgi:hypothetical protein